MVFSKRFANSFFIALLLSISGCKYHLDTEFIQRIPYHEKERLIFKATNEEKDTIDIGVFENYYEGKNQILKLNATMNFSSGSQNVASSGNTFFLAITALPNENAVLTLNLSTSNGSFPSIAKRINWLDSLPQVTLNVNDKTYSDVVVWHADTSTLERKSTFINKVYWSKRNGLLQYELNDKRTWRLYKRYNI
jgi:hypothetical protein